MKVIKSIRAGLFIALLVIFLTWFCPSSAASGYPVTVVDDTGRSFVLTKEPMRLISLAPSVTEMVFTAGGGRKLVGVTTYCNYPPEAALKPKIGGITDFNLERIVSLKPDLVIGIAQGRTKPLVDLLIKKGIAVFIIKVTGMDSMMSSIEKIVSLVNANSGELEEFAQLRKEYAAYKNAPIPTVHLKGLLIVSRSPVFASTRNSIEGEILEKAGFIMPEGTGPESYIIMGREKILNFGPQVIITTFDISDDELLKITGGINTNTPVKGAHYVMDEDLIQRPGPRLIKAFRILQSIYRKAMMSHREEIN